MMISPTLPAPGTKRCLPCASWGPWGPPTGSYGVSAYSLRLLDAEYVISWDLAPPPPGKKGVGYVHTHVCFLGAIGYHLGGYMGISRVDS